jgi:hypothetical protein
MLAWAALPKNSHLFNTHRYQSTTPSCIVLQDHWSYISGGCPMLALLDAVSVD